MRIHTRAPKNTTLHHPSMHPDTDTDQNTTKSRQFLTHLDQSRNCLYLLSRITGCALLILCWSTRDWVVAALFRRWTWKLWRATCRRAGRRVPSPRTVGGQAAVFVNVLRQSSEETRRHVLSVVYLQSKGHPLSALASVGDRRKVAEEMLARLAVASGRRISRKIATSRRLDLDVICFSDETIFRVDAVASNATAFFGIHRAKREVCYVGPLLSHFSRHIPPRSGLPLHGHSSPRCCWTHVVEPLQEEGRLDHGRTWLVHWLGRCQ